MVDEFCRAAEFVPTPGGTPLHLVATFQRGVRYFGFSAHHCVATEDAPAMIFFPDQLVQPYVGMARMICSFDI